MNDERVSCPDPGDSFFSKHSILPYHGSSPAELSTVSTPLTRRKREGESACINVFHSIVNKKASGC